MNLPAFDIPLPNFGFDIPVLLHPPLVHFAIVLPVFILILEIINLFMKRKGLTVTTVIFYILLIIIFFGAFVTGKTDGSEAWDLLTPEGQADLKEHKLIGIYLMLGSVVVFFLKLFAAALRTWWMKLIYMLVLIGFVGAVFYQGKEGGELVYKHGANNERVLDLSNQIDDLNDEIEELKENASEEATETSDTEEKASTEEEKQEEKAKEETPKQPETSESDNAEKASQPEDTQSAPASENTDSETNVTQKAAEAVEAAKESAAQGVEKATETAQEAAGKVAETAKKTVESVKEAGAAAADAAKKMLSGETETK